MVAMNLKAETISMMDKRSSIETEMNAIIETLCVPGGPGISGNLVDSEGFPRADIDIMAVRAQRSRLAELRNDYKDITDKIDKNLEVLHSARLTKVVPLAPISSELRNDYKAITDKIDKNLEVLHSARLTKVVPLAPISSDASASISPMDEDPIIRIPFALVDEITEGSPAAEDGLQLGDQILKFGIVEKGGNLNQRLASEVQSNQSLPIPTIIMRQGSAMNLTITPRQWHGRGFLGCHFRII